MEVKWLTERKLGDDNIQIGYIDRPDDVVSHRTDKTAFGPVTHFFAKYRFVVYVKSITGGTKMVLTWERILADVVSLFQQCDGFHPEQDSVVELITTDFSSTEDLINAIMTHLRALGIKYNYIGVSIYLDDELAEFRNSAAVDALYKDWLDTVESKSSCND